MIFFTLITVAAFLTICFECIPIEGIWDKSIKAGCVSLNNVDIINRLQGCECNLNVDHVRLAY